MCYQIIVKSLVVVVLVVIHPHLRQANGVFLHDVHPSSPFVRRSLTENMSHMGARHNFKNSTTHPNLPDKRNKDVFKTNFNENKEDL